MTANWNLYFDMADEMENLRYNSIKKRGDCPVFLFNL